ncbi:unnamed protein product [Pocillopora meandrina]|uniref:40S ribosomal protein S24 n=1 Tax=Pocillopora meandrina TaxID=46732 RepID=A0AAU9WAG8_9CNID|nr:unnamed protein product [Pocillopora meandrina]
MASCKQAKNLFDAKQVNSGDRIVKFVYLAFFAGLTISPDIQLGKTLEKKQQRVRTVKVRNARKAEERRKGKAREDGGKGHKKGWKKRKDKKG